MTDSETKDVQPHPSAAECVCINEGAESFLDKARIAATRTIIAVSKLREADPCLRPGAEKSQISPTVRTNLNLSIEWSARNRPNLEISYRIPDENLTNGVLRYEVNLPEGSMHFGPRMDLDMAESIGRFMGEGAKQALDRGWKPPLPDEVHMRS